MEEEKITLDRETFKTLASDTRISILKSLDQRRKTLSELSREFGMSVSTVSEHLSNLSSADLVVQRDEGHKWKYYELTRKGRGVLYPETRKVWIVLAASAIGIFLLGLDALKGRALQAYQAIMPLGEEVMGLPLATDVLKEGVAAPVTAPAASAPLAATAALPWIHIAGIMIFAALLGASIFLLYRKGTPRLV